MPYVMEAKENFDAERIALIEAITSYYTGPIFVTDQNYQGIQWDPVRRNLMYMHCQRETEDTPETNNTGHVLWDGLTTIEIDATYDPTLQWNASVSTKNIDTGVVTTYRCYDVDNLVPNGIGNEDVGFSDGTWRRFTADFQGYDVDNGNNGPGMTDPYTGNFWVTSESCQLYLFRLEDNYSQIISPMRPTVRTAALVKPVGMTGGAEVDSWVYAREIDDTIEVPTAYLYLTPREITAAETTADELLRYATFTYPVATADRVWFPIYNREIFDHAGNMYLASCSPEGGKNFKLYKFTQPTSANPDGSSTGGGFTDITPWEINEGPNADGEDYILIRNMNEYVNAHDTGSLIPMYLPETDDLVIIEKFFPEELDGIENRANMFWSCTYVGDPSGTPTFSHHSSFVTGYMTDEWVSTDIDGASYAVYDAFEINNYLGQSDYLYDIDYTERWFGFLCTKMVDGVNNGQARIVFVRYKFVNGIAPEVSRVVDEQGWDDAYPDYAEHENSAYVLTGGAPPPDFQAVILNAAGVAHAMQTVFNTDLYTPNWDVGIYDPETNSFWFSGGGSDQFGAQPLFSVFDPAFNNRARVVADDTPYDGDPELEDTDLIMGVAPPFLKLTFPEDEDSPDVDEDIRLRVWQFPLDAHDYYIIRAGTSETFAYDLTTDTWSIWRSPDQFVWRAHVGTAWVGMGETTAERDWSDVVAGDDTTGTLWILDPTFGQDEDTDGVETPFTRVVTGGLPYESRDVKQCNAVQLNLSLGNPQPVGATITLETSDDGGHTVVSHGDIEIEADVFYKVVEWRSLGLMRQPGRLFTFTDTGAAVRIDGADLR